MKVFISSLIRGLAPVRTAAENALRTLSLEAIKAENFGARPESPQIACLDGVRSAEAIVIILGESYGSPQQSGLSATHEEFREARDRCPVFAFVQSQVTPETQQADFIREVQSWASGVYTGSFSSPEDLERAVTTALHRWLVSQASGGIDESDLKSRADALFANDRRSSSRDVAQMILVVVPGPTQSLLRPIQLEEQGFSRNVRRRLLDDETGIFTSELGTHSQIEGHTLHFEQEGRFFEIDEQGSVVIGLPIGDEVEGYHPVLIEEEVQARLRQAASFAASMLEMIDPLHRITHALLAAKAEGAEHSAWRSRAEHAASPNSIRIGLYDAERGPVTLSPAARTRAALNNEAEALADDLMVLLRRQYRTQDRKHR